MSCAKEASACVSISSTNAARRNCRPAARLWLRSWPRYRPLVRAVLPPSVSPSIRRPSPEREDDHCSGDALVDASSRRAAISSRCRRSLKDTPSRPAISFSLALSLPSPSGRRSAAIGLGLFVCPGIDGVLQRRREAPGWVRRVRFAFDDEGEDPVGPADRLNSRIS